MIAENYTYDVTTSPRGGVDIVLRSNDGTREKKFYVANGTIAGLSQHMESLSDENCDGFWPRPRKEKKHK